MVLQRGDEHAATVRLGDFLSNALELHIVVVLFFARIVQVRVVLDEADPAIVHLNIVVHELLPQVHETFASHRVVQHYDASGLLVDLVGEERRLVVQILESAGLLRQHHLESELRVVPHSDGFTELRLRNAPLVHLMRLLSEEHLLFFLEGSCQRCVLNFAVFPEGERLFKALGLLPAPFEPTS